MAEPTVVPAAPAQVPPAETPKPSSMMTLAIAVVVIAALAFGKDVFIPIILAVLLSFVLAPFVDLLRRLRLGRVPAVIIAAVVTLGVILGLGGIMGLQIAELANDLPQYRNTVRQKVASLQGGMFSRATDIVKDLGREIDRATETPATPAAPGARPTTAPAPEEKPLVVEVKQPDLSPVELAKRFLLPALEPVATGFITIIVVIFILMQREDLRDRMIRLFGSTDLHRTTGAMDDAARRLSKYFLTQLALNSAFGVAIAIGLWFIGVPSPILWGVLAALSRFIPYIGAIVAGAIPLILAAAVDPTGWTMAIWVFALFIVLEPLMGHVVEPLAYGQSTGLSPFAVVVSAIFWTWLWGPIGLLISTPLTVCLVVLGRHVERLEFLDVLLGDRPALTPIENFYQRMLAGDPDEAMEQAEQLLKERSLSSYYDEVALKGLQLAAIDSGRGVLVLGQLDRIKNAVLGLVRDLAEQQDVDPVQSKAKEKEKEAKEGPGGPLPSDRDLPVQPAISESAPEQHHMPPEWRTEHPVMCIAGRGPLDEAAASMLAQLLGKHALSARVVPHEAVSRSNIIGLDVTGVAMVCISYIELSGSPAHLRYLIKRLRQKLPKAPILVGLWPEEDSVLSDETMRKAIGADHFVTSLREAVDVCCKAAQTASDLPDPEETPAEPSLGIKRLEPRPAVAAE